MYLGGPLALYPALLAMAVLSFCLVGPTVGNWLVYGDLSYGIYVIHFPVFQAIKSVGILQDRQGLLFILTTVVVLSLSVLLWRFIESPALRGRWIKKKMPIPVLAPQNSSTYHYGTTYDLVNLVELSFVGRQPEIAGRKLMWRAALIREHKSGVSHDLPLNFHPKAIRASVGFPTPFLHHCRLHTAGLRNQTAGFGQARPAPP